jgi:hypothetical protein
MTWNWIYGDTELYQSIGIPNAYLIIWSYWDCVAPFCRFDAHFEIYQGETIKRSFDGTPCIYECNQDYDLKKLGPFSWYENGAGYDYNTILQYLSYTPVVGDHLRGWIAYDSANIGAHAVFQLYDEDWWHAYWVELTPPPIPPPEFLPLWKTRIGEL